MRIRQEWVHEGNRVIVKVVLAATNPVNMTLNEPDSRKRKVIFMLEVSIKPEVIVLSTEKRATD